MGTLLLGKCKHRDCLIPGEKLSPTKLLKGGICRIEGCDTPIRYCSLGPLREIALVSAAHRRRHNLCSWSQADSSLSSWCLRYH